MTKISESSLWASFQNIRTMNDIAGRFDGDTSQLRAAVDLGLSLNFEELTEAIAEFEAGNAVKLVAEAADMWVVLSGLLQTLEAAGFDVAQAMEKTDAANLAKFPKVTHQTSLLPEDVVAIECNEKYNRLVFKRADGKFLKPVGWKKADLSDCAPANFFEGS